MNFMAQQPLDLDTFDAPNSFPFPILAVLSPPSQDHTNRQREKWTPTEFDTILPVQFYARVASRKTTSGEQRLLLAIVEDAMRSYVRAKGSATAEKRAEFREARDWFFNKIDRQVFSFEWVCSTLDFDPSFVRRQLSKLSGSDIPRKHYYNRRRRTNPIRSKKPRGMVASM